MNFSGVHVVEMGFQRALYAHPVVATSDGPVTVLPPVSLPWLAMLLALVLVGSLVLLVLAWRTFFHMSADFAEDL